MYAERRAADRRPRPSFLPTSTSLHSPDPVGPKTSYRPAKNYPARSPVAVSTDDLYRDGNSYGAAVNYGGSASVLTNAGDDTLVNSRVFGLGETLATTLVGLATRIAAKIAAYTYAFAVNRMLGRPQGRIKELWA